MPASPYNFANIAAWPTKFFGGNGVQIPGPDGGPTGPGSQYSYAFIFANWATYFPNWIIPQIDNWLARGMKQFRHIGALDGVLLGIFTQTYYESCLTDLCNAIRSRGMTLGMCGLAASSYTALGPSGTPASFTAAQWAAPSQSALTNVYIPNQDIVAYYEPGNQESDLGGGITLTNQIANILRSGTTIPFLASGSLGDFSAYDNTVFNVFGLHSYPQFGQGGTSFNSSTAWFYNAAATTGGRPILMEEYGLHDVTYQAKADFMAVALQAWFGHPSCAGCTPWGGQGPTPDGDWTLWSPPALPYVPGPPWPDTVASVVLANWGPLNRNQSLALSLDAPTTINGTIADLVLDAASNSVSTPLITNVDLNTYLWGACACSLTGTVTLTGTAPSQYTVTFAALDVTNSVYHVIGTPLVVTGSGSGVAVAMAGTVPTASKWRFVVRVQRTSGVVDGTMTALSLTLAYGNAYIPLTLHFV